MTGYISFGYPCTNKNVKTNICGLTGESQAGTASWPTTAGCSDFPDSCWHHEVARQAVEALHRSDERMDKLMFVKDSSF